MSEQSRPLEQGQSIKQRLFDRVRKFSVLPPDRREALLRQLRSPPAGPVEVRKPATEPNRRSEPEKLRAAAG